MRLVFLNIPGPGGGGGGGGALQKRPPPKAERKGRSTVSSPMPPRPRPTPWNRRRRPAPEPPPTLKSEPMPVVSAPIVQAPAEDRDRAGVFQEARAEAQSRGPGVGGGVGQRNRHRHRRGQRQRRRSWFWRRHRRRTVPSGIGRRTASPCFGKCGRTTRTKPAAAPIEGEVVLEIVVKQRWIGRRRENLEAPWRRPRRTRGAGRSAMAIRAGPAPRFACRRDRRSRRRVQAALGAPPARRAPIKFRYGHGSCPAHRHALCRDLAASASGLAWRVMRDERLAPRRGLRPSTADLGVDDERPIRAEHRSE